MAKLKSLKKVVEQVLVKKAPVLKVTPSLQPDVKKFDPSLPENKQRWLR